MFIKVTDQVVANALIQMGTKYMTECVCGKCTYIFEQTPEIMQFIIEHYGNDKVIIDAALRY